MSDDAGVFSEFLSEKPHVHAADMVSDHAVVAIKKTEKNDDVITYHESAVRGWRVGLTVPTDGGDVVVFVPIDAEEVEADD